MRRCRSLTDDHVDDKDCSDDDMMMAAAHTSSKRYESSTAAVRPCARAVLINGSKCAVLLLRVLQVTGRQITEAVCLSCLLYVNILSRVANRAVTPCNAVDDARGAAASRKMVLVTDG